jgi:hypothetical protein
MQISLVSWYTIGLPRVIMRVRTMIASFEAQLAVKETIKHLTEPLFQDYTLAGRFIGALFRVGRILLGGILYLGISIIGILILAMWVIAPFVPAIAVAGFIIGADSTATPPLSTEFIP